MRRGRGWRARALWATAAVLLLGSTVASCGGSPDKAVSAATPSGSPSALATDAATGTPVYGSTRCSVTGRSSETRGHREIVYEHFSCVDEMSDPRVSGSDEVDVETAFSMRGDNPAAPWTAELVVSNDGGSWRGTCTGALEFTTDPIGLPTNYGICTLAGEGGYAGLGYRYLVAGGNEELVLAGWIEPAD